MGELYRKLGPIGMLKAIWSIICLWIKSLANKTNLMTEYHKECDKMTEHMNTLLAEHIKNANVIPPAPT